MHYAHLATVPRCWGRLLHSFSICHLAANWHGLSGLLL
jgi:hypothetical protein